MLTNKDLPFEIRNCHTIGEFGQKLRERSESHKFQFGDYEHNHEHNQYITNSLPIDLEEGQIYIITSWNSNAICKAVGPKSFEIIESYGEEFKIGKDYLIILPTY
jgi:hypothetical protein